MNIRKWLCKIFHAGTWLYRAFDCKRYEPQPPMKMAFICHRSGLLAIEGVCPADQCEWIWMKESDVPTEKCNYHVAPPPPPPPPPPPKDKLTEEFWFNNCGKVFSAFFPLSVLQLRDSTGWTWDYFKSFIDKIAKEDLSNVLRFIPMGIWHPVSQVKPVLHFPHMEPNGKWELASTNPEWQTRVFDRLEYMVEKGITPQIELVDGCSVHTMPDGPWHDHWLNSNRNWGWKGEAVGDVHPSVYTHWYEWDHVGEMWYAEKGYTDESQMTPEDHDYMMRCRRVGEYWIDFLGWVTKTVTSTLGRDAVLLGHNEIDGGDGWHTWMRKNIYEPANFDTRRVVTSTYDDFYGKGGIKNYYGLSMHGVWNDGEYQKRLGNGTIFDPKRFVLSGDGDESMAWGKNPQAVSNLAHIAFRDCWGMERNEQDACPLDAMNWTCAEIMRTEFINSLN